MLIGIDCQALLIKEHAGPEKYLENLIKAFAKFDRGNHYKLYFKKEPSKDYFANLTSANPNFSCVIPSAKLSWTQWGLARELRKNPVDVFFAPFHTLPILATFWLFRLRNKWVSMVHGLEYGFEHNFLKALWFNLPLFYTIKFSDAIIVPSAHTKEKLVQKGWKESEKVSVIPEGVSERFKKYSPEEILPVLQKYNLEGVPYILFVSTIQPRKNVPGLVAGFAEALESGEIPAEMRLILAGKKGWAYEESLEAPKKYGVEGNVRFLGRVSDQDLPFLFSGAAAYVSASLEEGFGLPLVEAMASETPAVVSDIPSYKAIAWGNALYFDPNDPVSISRSLIQVFSENKAARVIEAKKRSKKYSWEETAKNTLATLTF